MVKRLFLAAAGVALAGCATMAVPTETFVRMHNSSQSTLENVRANFSGQEVIYGTLPPGVRSDYRPIRVAYRYALVEAEVNGRKFDFQPQDYMGETPLGPGRFTYRLTTDTSGGTLGIRLARD
jgi:hypothetical protein